MQGKQPTSIPTARQRVQIAVRAEKSPKTVDRAYRGLPVYDTTRASVTRAAVELGLPPPPPATEVKAA